MSGHAVFTARLRALPTAWAGQNPDRARQILHYGIHSLVTAQLRAREVVLGPAGSWYREGPGPFDEEDLPSDRELAARAVVVIDNARRHAREHTTAATRNAACRPAPWPNGPLFTWPTGIALPRPASAVTGSTSSRCPAPASP
ncbi:hypothetical protein ACFCV8_02345 [Streptomyces sp. NPDC056347]|uniref:hypothetical protein n=1 Tax=Streptomyces sp. NPDC056347 TaxID=3345790 RepID=UPI0035D88DAF